MAINYSGVRYGNSLNILLLPESADLQTDYVIYDKAQIDHVIQVLKLAVGERLKVGVRNGKLGTAIISNIDVGLNYIELTAINCLQCPPAKLNLTLLLALPRPKVLRRLIIDMTAIGVNNIILTNSLRTDKSYWQSPMLKRIDEFVTEGLQQGVDTIAPLITLQKRLKPYVEDQLSLLTQTQQAVVAHPYAAQSLTTYERLHGLPQIMCIGSEGGWIDYELELFKANGCEVVNVGKRILRTEAAVNALCGRYL